LQRKMVPPKATKNSKTIPKRQCSQPAMTPIFEETQEESSSMSRFPRDYIPPRKSPKKMVNLQKDMKYTLVEPEILEGVILEGDMLCLIHGLKYDGQDITNENTVL